ncbi:FAD-binding oxidoreductase [Kutzneria viridogrisea]|uniref:FAD/FMN-containing dehydrogenase n=1 Tax=Kutzneria viridogrisea TaxID=47990 RepID=A0ABR6BJL9_9PSEU|nr:FAD/FMN-containing dehydrogenase [Kutzneria viridogrisea]
MTAALLDRLGPEVVLTGQAAEGFVRDERGLFDGVPAAVVLPRCTEEVALAVRTCAENRIPVVPQGGGTGLVGGAVPVGRGEQVLLNLRRMNRIRAVYAEDFALVAEAGCVLAEVRAAAERADRLFPLSLASEGSCQLGGNLATNAGGLNVVRYGNTRDLVLGLEVVLADGTVWNGLQRLRKDNTGYDVKQLFVGSEGTLGVITAASLRLFPLPRRTSTALLGLVDIKSLVPLLELARRCFDDRVSSLELLPAAGLDLLVRHVPGSRYPMGQRHPWYLLVEAGSSTVRGDLDAVMDAFLTTALDSGHAADAVLAVDRADADRLWALRENLSEAQKRAGGTVKHDVSVPLSEVGEFVIAGTRLVHERLPGAQVIALGHVGDGNVHFNVLPPPGHSARDTHLWHRVNEFVHELVARFGGSISAEHGIGLLKREAHAEHADPVRLRLQAAVKQALDPLQIMNPGKVLSQDVTGGKTR